MGKKVPTSKPPPTGVGGARQADPRFQQSQPAAAATPSLPSGVEWPKDPKAKRIAETLFRDMSKSRKAALDERQKAYRAACFTWHPDKNPRYQELATGVFQFLQSLKKWYFEN
jgi:hypothetical protein